MNAIQKDYGLSARQQTIHPTRTDRTGSSITKIISLILLTLVAVVGTSCRQDSRGQDTASAQEKKLSKTDSLNQPQVSIKVNRRYDDKGNLVGFDSTYSSYYSNIQGDTSRMDSLMKSFDSYFGRQHSSLFDRQFNSLFFNDSLRYPDFFHNDFFMKRYELNDEYLRSMMQRMDSIKNRFFRESTRLQSRERET